MNCEAGEMPDFSMCTAPACCTAVWRKTCRCEDSPTKLCVGHRDAARTAAAWYCTGCGRPSRLLRFLPLAGPERALPRLRVTVLPPVPADLAALMQAAGAVESARQQRAVEPVTRRAIGGAR